jgi:hypothetical protein
VAAVAVATLATEALALAPVPVASAEFLEAEVRFSSSIVIVADRR